MSHNATKLSIIDMPIHDTPVFEEKQGKEWVSYGRNDEYGAYLEQLYMGSSIHSAVVNGVASMIYGDGLNATDKDRDDGTKEQWLRLQSLLAESEPDLLRKLAMDLKLYGQCYINTIWNRSRTRIAQMRHLPVHTIRAGCADSDGKVDLFYYKPDWKAKNTKPDTIKAFCTEDRVEASRVLQVKRYSPSYHYYGLPDYVGSTGYVELDHQIQSFHLNNIKNGMYPSMLISFNNGIPTDEEQRLIEAKVNDKFGGSEGAGKVLITFNDGSDTQPTFTPVQNNGTDAMYEYLSREVTNKVLSGHRVTSPLLFGVRGEGSGFGNNADELRDSYSLFHHTVVIPFQRVLLKGLEPVMAANHISLDLYFEPLKPADFIDITEDKQASKEEEPEPQQLSEEYDLTEVAEWLMSRGEVMDDTWEMIDSRDVDYELEAVHDALWTFASVPAANPDEDSKGQDTELIRVRYEYAPQQIDTGPKGKSRDFCRMMVSSSKSGTVFRKQDIEAATGANPGFGKGGAANYSIWLYKGGPRCRHWWKRVTYLKKDNTRISVREARRLINSLPPAERDKNRLPVNPPEVAMWPNDMDYKGFHPDNPNKPIDAQNAGTRKSRAQ